MTFCSRIGTGIGGVLLAWVLALVNYTPNVTQTKTAVLGITFNFIWGTVIGLLLAGVFMALYLKLESQEETAETKLHLADNQD